MNPAIGIICLYNTSVLYNKSVLYNMRTTLCDRKTALYNMRSTLYITWGALCDMGVHYVIWCAMQYEWGIIISLQNMGTPVEL